MKLINKGKILYLFNLQMDLDSRVLAAAHDWANSFSEHFSEVRVITTRRGRCDLLPAVTVREIGGGSLFLRIRALYRLTKILFEISKVRKDAFVFHHMSNRTAGILGIPIRTLGIRQGIWYSHSHQARDLRLAVLSTNFVVTSIACAFPFESSKLHFVVHGIDANIFKIGMEGNRSGIVSIGRIARVKQFDAGIAAIHQSQIKSKMITLIGPEEDDGKLLSDLQQKADSLGVELEYIPQLQRSQLEQILHKFSIFFSGTPKSVDKAAIEAAMCGLFLVTTNENVLNLTGMSEVWASLGLNPPAEVSEQITLLENIPDDIESQLRIKLSKLATERNDLEQVTRRIAALLQENRNV